MPPTGKRKRAKESVIKLSDDTRKIRRSARVHNNHLQATTDSINDVGHLAKRATSSAPKTSKKESEEFLMTNPKSPLVHADLVKLFSSPKAWNCLDEDQKQELLSMLPTCIHANPDPDPDNPEAKIPPLPDSFLRFNNEWRAALRDFQYNLESGRYTLEWQQKAKQAVQERAQGKFDDFKEHQYEQFWGQKQNINYAPARDSAKVKLQTLIEHGVVRVGDVWKYCHAFGEKKAPIVVEKEAKITSIDGARLGFLVPTRRTFLGAVGEPEPCSDTPIPRETEIHNIAGPNTLKNKILEIDGRVKEPPNGNAWKEIRCLRNNQDMGSLWEVRYAWYAKHHPEKAAR